MLSKGAQAWDDSTGVGRYRKSQGCQQFNSAQLVAVTQT